MLRTRPLLRTALVLRNILCAALALCAGLLLSLAGPRPSTLLPSPPGHLVKDTVLTSLDAPVAPASRFQWPLDGTPRLLRRFDPPARPWLPGHRGVDLAPAPGATGRGATVRAAGDGRVRFAGQIAGRPVVSVDHAGGLRTTYEPVEPLVHAGDQVARGDPIGRLASGHPGCAVEACLHWGLLSGDIYLDPLTLLGLGQVRLLPLSGR